MYYIYPIWGYPIHPTFQPPFLSCNNIYCDKCSYWSKSYYERIVCGCRGTIKTTGYEKGCHYLHICILFQIGILLCPLHVPSTGQRMLAQLVSHSGGTPQVLSSTPRGSEFQAEGKKIPSLTPCAKALVVRRPRSAWGPLHGPGR